MTRSNRSVRRVAGVIGAFIGAGLGYWAVGIVAAQGFHAIVLPASLPGIAAGVIARERSVAWAVLYSLVGAAAALYTEWAYRPFIANRSLAYFSRHIGDLQPTVLVVIGVGAVIGGVLAISFGHRPRALAEKTIG